MTDGLNYPDNLYADHEEAKARRVANQAPTGAYRAAPEMPEAERKLRTALAYVCHARDLIMRALGDDKVALEWPIPNRPVPDRVPKWDPKWGLQPGSATAGQTVSDGLHWNGPIPPPNCDGLSARDIRAPHPMSAEVIRDHDERLAGGESHL